MKGLRVFGQNVLAKGKSFAGVLIASAGMVAVPAFAADGDMDVSSVVAYITGGLAALALIGPAWTGFKYLQKVWNRV